MIKDKCRICLGSGQIFESFQPPRICGECNGQGLKLIQSSTQIIHFIGGYKRTIKEIISIWENECVHILTKGGIEWVINKNNVLCIEKL